MNIPLTEEQKVKILNSTDIYKVMQQILLREEKIDQEKEHFWLICLAQNNHIQNIELISLGSAVATMVEPMNVFRIAVMKGAVKVILVHNHPSGELKPSQADEDITDRLIQVGRILNIHVIDHLIITTVHYNSFMNSGLLEKLERSSQWVPKFEQIEQLRKEEKKIREEMIKAAAEKNLKKGETKGRKEEKIEIAKKLLKKNTSIEDIIEITGLTKKEIEKIKAENSQ
jgi:DNA repair protein RadC